MSEPERTREGILETVAVLVVELREIAQPHELAELRELALDAADADTPEQLAQIAAQVEGLRVFCLKRAQSQNALRLDFVRLTRHHT
jgi:hypothetical protein